MTIKGKCHCGKTAYTVAQDELTDVATCHCSACRRSTGGTHVTWATVPLRLFKWEAEPPGEYKSSDHGIRYFCMNCGAQLAFFTNHAPDAIDITITTLDDAHRFAPSRHIWTRSKLKWVNPADGLPQMDRET